MVTASVNKKQLTRALFAAAAAAAVLFAGIFAVKKLSGQEQKPAAIPGGSNEQRVAYLQSFGYQLASESTVAEVLVPDHFDERFEAYNEMLRTLGFDLEPLRGKAVKKCCYSITAGAPHSGNLTAVLLVQDGNIVGGHLLDSALQRIYPLFEVTDDAPSEAGVLDTGAEIVAEGQQPVFSPEDSQTVSAPETELPASTDGSWPVD